MVIKVYDIGKVVKYNGVRLQVVKSCARLPRLLLQTAGDLSFRNCRSLLQALAMSKCNFQKIR